MIDVHVRAAVNGR